jgi:three-Cys-motif partner protein
MSGGQYNWSASGSPARLLEHSRAKLAVYREYLRRYVREMTKDIRISKLALNVVDGFCGGGVYRAEQGNDLVYGSPVIFLEVMQEMQAEVQARRTAQFQLDYRLHFVDKSPAALSSLQAVLKTQGFDKLVGTRVFLHQSTFEEALPSLLNDVSGRGNTIFVLDQYGYTAVPFEQLALIFNRLSKPEIILTFNYDQLVTWMQQYDRVNRTLLKLGVGAIGREEYELSIVEGHREFFIQRVLHQAFLSFASYFTPFFVMSRGSNMAYWLVHLSSHARAKHVMQRLHWEMSNTFSHFGGVGYNMLGYDPKHAPAGRQAYLFDDQALERTLYRMQDDLPPLVRAYGDGVQLWKLFSDTANDAPADAEILRQGVISLAEIGALEILTPTGGEKRSIATLKLNDIIRVPPQATLLLPGRPRPLFARQPSYLAGPPPTKRKPDLAK